MRERIRRIIMDTLQDEKVMQIEDVDEKFRFIRKHYYPFSERSGYKYRVWLEELRMMKALYRGGFLK